MIARLYLVEYQSDPDEDFKILKEIGIFKNEAEIRQALRRLPRYNMFDKKCYMIKKESSANMPEGTVLPFKK
jgi:hypothetical protein